MLAIACGYEDADDLDHPRIDPGFKPACGRLPDSGRDLCSQPTVSRWEKAPNLCEVSRHNVDAVVRLAHGLAAEVAAAGVETQAQLRVLAELGRDVAQGFLLSRPIAPEALGMLAAEPPARVERAAA